LYYVFKKYFPDNLWEELENEKNRLKFFDVRSKNRQGKQFIILNLYSKFYYGKLFGDEKIFYNF